LNKGTRRTVVIKITAKENVTNSYRPHCPLKNIYTLSKNFVFHMVDFCGKIVHIGNLPLFSKAIVLRLYFTEMKMVKTEGLL
jgi:hypothetical protein